MPFGALCFHLSLHLNPAPTTHHLLYTTPPAYSPAGAQYLATPSRNPAPPTAHRVPHSHPASSPLTNHPAASSATSARSAFLHQIRRPGAHPAPQRTPQPPNNSCMPTAKPSGPYYTCPQPVAFKFAAFRTQYDPVWDKIVTFACNKHNQPLIVFHRKQVLNHAATQSRLLDHIALKLGPKYSRRLEGEEGGDTVVKPIDASLFTSPAVSVLGGGQGDTVCMHAKTGHVPGFFPSGEYVQLELGKDKDNKQVLNRVHRLLCWLLRGAPPDWHSGDSIAVAGHAYGRGKCNGARSCLQPCHLDWQTPEENQNDASRHRNQTGCACHVHLCTGSCADLRTMACQRHGFP